MYKTIQQHKKKLMAVFGVMLMVVFILPSSFRNTQHDPVVGYIGDKPIHSSLLLEADNDVKILADAGLQSQLLSLTGPALSEALKNRPELWALLKIEAQDMGIVTDPQTASQILAYVAPEGTSTAKRNAYARAISSFLQVSQAFEYVATLPKTSQPRIQQTIASQYQVLTLSAIELNADSRLNQVSEPTAAEIDQQLATFGNQQADLPTTENPFGFGYQFPARIQVQYLMLPESEVRRIVLASRTPYQWDVEFNLYYQKNLSQFPTTAPATTASTQSTGMGPIAPTTKPSHPLGFEDYREQVELAVLQPLIERQKQVILDALMSLLNSNYQAATRVGNATTQPSGTFATFAYLQGVQQTIEKLYNVRLAIHDEPTWLDAQTLHGKPLFHDAFLLDSRINNQGQTQPVQIPCTYWLFTHATALAAEEIRTSHSDLPLYQPSITFRTSDGGRVIFRITDAHMPRAPLASEKEQVLPRVTADLRMKAAYALTLKAAEDLKAKAAKSGQNLATIAKDTGLKLIDIGPIQRGMSFYGQTLPDSVSGFALADVSKPLMIQQAYDMLHLASEKNLHPQEILNLQHEHKVLLAQLESVRIDNPAPWGATVAAYRKLAAQDAVAIQSGWFDPENIIKRTNYRKP